MDGGDQEKCVSIVKFLKKHEDAWPFLEPVDPIKLGIPDYLNIIKHPMDLQTIEHRLGKHNYKSPDDVRSDVDLMISNALLYNQPGSDICKMAKTLQAVAKRKFSAAKFSNNLSTNGASAQPPEKSSKKSSIKRESSPVGSIVKDKKRKNKEEDEPVSRAEAPVEAPPIKTKLKISKENVPMTFDEKRDLGRNINRLNPFQLTEVVEIIKGALTLLDTEKEDIEVDMNDLDTQTLRKLERFVNSCLNKEDPDRKREKLSS